MSLGPMMPRFLQEAFLNICLIIGVIVAAVGLYCLIFTNLSKLDAALVTALGAAIFFGFRKVKSLRSDYEGYRPDKGPEDEV